MTEKDKPMGWKDIPVGAVVDKPGNAAAYHTGGWRSERPVFDSEHCIQCGVCYIYCPDCSIVMTPEGYPEVLLDYCKGCGICAKECYMSAFGLSCFKMVDEEEFR